MEKKYYIRNSSGVQEVTEGYINQASLSDNLLSYGVLDEKSGHAYIEHIHCHDNFCNICEGGLSHCILCGQYEGGLTTHCCSRSLTDEEQKLVYNEGNLDYRYGRWFKGVRNRVMLSSKITMSANYTTILATFMCDKPLSVFMLKKVYWDYNTDLIAWGEKPIIEVKEGMNIDDIGLSDFLREHTERYPKQYSEIMSLCIRLPIAVKSDIFENRPNHSKRTIKMVSSMVDLEDIFITPEMISDSESILEYSPMDSIYTQQYLKEISRYDSGSESNLIDEIYCNTEKISNTLFDYLVSLGYAVSLSSQGFSDGKCYRKLDVLESNNYLKNISKDNSFDFSRAWKLLNKGTKVISMVSDSEYTLNEDKLLAIDGIICEDITVEEMLGKWKIEKKEDKK